MQLPSARADPRAAAFLPLTCGRCFWRPLVLGALCLDGACALRLLACQRPFAAGFLERSARIGAYLILAFARRWTGLGIDTRLLPPVDSLEATTTPDTRRERVPGRCPRLTTMAHYSGLSRGFVRSSFDEALRPAFQRPARSTSCTSGTGLHTLEAVTHDLRAGCRSSRRSARSVRECARPPIVARARLSSVFQAGVEACGRALHEVFELPMGHGSRVCRRRGEASRDRASVSAMFRAASAIRSAQFARAYITRTVVFASGLFGDPRLPGL